MLANPWRKSLGGVIVYMVAGIYKASTFASSVF
jgi:hypothetical protein